MPRPIAGEQLHHRELLDERFGDVHLEQIRSCRPCNGVGGIWIGQPDADPPLALVACPDCNGTGEAT